MPAERAVQTKTWGKQKKRRKKTNDCSNIQSENKDKTGDKKVA